MSDKTYSTTMGICNKCGYIGECEVEANGHLTHYRRDGTKCNYSAASTQQLEKVKVDQDIRSARNTQTGESQ